MQLNGLSPPVTLSTLQLAACSAREQLLLRPDVGLLRGATNFCSGSAAPVRGPRMQSFRRDPLPVAGGHPRTTAVAVAGCLGGVIESQVPG